MKSETAMKKNTLPFISVVIPNHNNSSIIGACLRAAFAVDYDNYEVIVVDDCSADNSVEIIESFPCKLIRLTEHAGASGARNAGAYSSQAEVLFFIDADCLLKSDALSIAVESLAKYGAGTIIGGTYTLLPYDMRFFSIFQSVFIHFFETKNCGNPDYVATHAMLINKKIFLESGGFSEDFMPILEDVEFSHRLRRAGFKLVMEPRLMVTHVFNFSMVRSLRNAVRKSDYWTAYSISNQDLLSDSGTASVELKANVAAAFLCILLILTWVLWPAEWLLYLCGAIGMANILVNRLLFRLFFQAKGTGFGLLASVYYMTLYAFAVGAGAVIGVSRYVFLEKNGGRLKI